MRLLHEILNKNNILHRIRLNERISIAMPMNKMMRLIVILKIIHTIIKNRILLFNLLQNLL